MPERRALIVGNNLQVATSLSHALEPRLWTIENAPDNAAALAMVELMPFDLIVTDQKTSGKQDLDLLSRSDRSIRIRGS